MNSKNPRMKALIEEHRRLVGEIQLHRVKREDARRRCATLSSPLMQGDANARMREWNFSALQSERRAYQIHDQSLSTLNQQVTLIMVSMREEASRK